jgi:predicted nucleic acid-binding protein
MATTTTTTTPATATTPAITAVTTSWFKLHETLLLAVLVLGTLGYGVERYFDAEVAKNNVQVALTQQQVLNDQKNAAAIAATVAQDRASLQAEVQADHALIASLAASVASRNTGLVAQTKVDADLSLTGLAARWNQLLPTVTPTVTTTGIGLTAQGAHDTVASLEQLPVLIQNLKDETAIAGNYQQEVQKSDILVTDLNNQVTGLNKQLADSSKECIAQVAAVKAEGKKNSIKWAKRGFILGFIAGIWAGHAAGI